MLYLYGIDTPEFWIRSCINLPKDYSQLNHFICRRPRIMQFSLTTLLFLLPAFAIATPITPAPRQILPTGQTVKQDIINIHNAVLALDATVQAYTGSPFPTSLVEGTPVLLGVAEIHRVNRAGFRHALAALPFTVQDSNDVIDAVVDTGKLSPHPYLPPPYVHRELTSKNKSTQASQQQQRT